ncbi:uncharacterized protein TERG_11874 [Trichophyton rubrum CBS 118892]|uniref:Uncharacterized protein n=1 Tax=Trichophyton rubrum (strain ATCC MYA-4607 / CBS 118892) TaxID=559305 RepID=A0A080WF92_TRIRC|nr:uncharacterized protein TERG_11874 [Trichophyton rubrum CBS 118892]KFL60926.1 hypothetical protein TERG_11874 [Trichophyton rubrum CBS 118892]
MAARKEMGEEQIGIKPGDKGRSWAVSLAAALKEGFLREPPRSPLPVRRRACLMVSTFRSLLSMADGLWGQGGGLRGTRAPRLGEESRHLGSPGETLVGGELPGPWEEMGERMGEGDLLFLLCVL